MVPVPEGETAVVSKYWVVKFAVYVLATLGATTVWEIAPESLQLLHAY
jgi:hypothetical protein